MRLRSRFLGISTLLALAGLLASFGIGCVCEPGSTGASMAAMPEMPEMSMAHCHAEEAGARLSSPCCCGAAPRVPTVAEALLASFSPERPALAADLPNVALAAVAERSDEPHFFDLLIDRAPPPAFRSPLRI